MMARLSKRQRAILDAKEAAAAEAEPAGQQDGQPPATLGPAAEDDDDDGGDGVSLDEAFAPKKKRRVGTETAPLMEGEKRMTDEQCEKLGADALKKELAMRGLRNSDKKLPNKKRLLKHQDRHFGTKIADEPAGRVKKLLLDSLTALEDNDVFNLWYDTARAEAVVDVAGDDASDNDAPDTVNVNLLLRAARDHFNLPVDSPPPGAKRRSVAKASGAARDAASEAAALETLSTDWEDWKSLRLMVVLFSLDNEGTLVKIMRGCERAELEEQKAWDELAGQFNNAEVIIDKKVNGIDCNLDEDLAHTGKELSGKWSALKTCFAKFKLEMEKSGNQGDDVLLEKASKIDQFMWDSYEKNAAFMAAIARDLPPHASREAGSSRGGGPPVKGDPRTAGFRELADAMKVLGGDPEKAKAVQKATILEKIGTNVDKVADESFKPLWEKKMKDLLEEV